MEPAHPSDDELSAYLNGDSADLAARQRLETHLESCVACRERLAELRTVVRLLRGFEHPVPKRSFRLDPGMVSAPPLPEPEPVRIDPWIVRVQPALRRLTAIAAVLLVLLVSADVLTHRDSSESGSRETSALSSANQAPDSTSVMSAGAAESVPKSTAAATQAPAATAASSSGGESSSAGSSAEAPVTSAASGQATSESVSPSSAADDARSSEGFAPEASAAAMSVQQTEASGQPPADAVPAPNAATHGGRSSWRLVELAVGVVVIWLLFLTVVLPRLPRQRRS